MNATIRQLKIAMITDTPNEIISWFRDLCSKLHNDNVRVYNNCGQEHVYYIRSINIDSTIQMMPIFYIDYHTQSFLCDYRYYWSKLEQNFSLDYDDITEVTMFLVEYVLKVKPLHPVGEALYYDNAMLSALNNIGKTL